METWTAKVEAIHASLIIQVLVLPEKLCQVRVGLSKLFGCDRALNYNSHTVSELAKNFPVFLRKDDTEKSRTKAKNVVKILSGFIASGYLLRGVPWWTVKRGRKVSSCS